VQFPRVKFLISVAGTEQFPQDSGREVAFAGRSNAGKSSAINAILARKGLARTSKTPGRTKLLNFFEVEPGQRIIDLPGYGYARASPVEKKQWTALVGKLPQRENIAGLFLIVDIRRGFMESDMQLVEWAASAGWELHILLAKADKLNQRERAAVLKDAESILEEVVEGVSVQLFSAHDGIGVATAQKRLIEMLTSSRTENPAEAV
jgi:GTP-binding protein